MATNNATDIQHHIRENAEDVQKYLLDLANWETDMQKKDQELKKSQISGEQTKDLPPIRNLLSKGKKKSRNRKQKDSSSKSRAKSCNFKVLDKDDADSELKGMDKERSSTSENNEDDDNEEDDNENHVEEEVLSMQKRQQLAVFNKDKGNAHFNKGNFDLAIECYTTGMELDPDNALLPANRAMALLRKQQYQAAENDCTLCLSMDDTYVKAYLRRATARSGLQKYDLAIEDFVKALQLEPDNKQAEEELRKLKQIVGRLDAKKVRHDSVSDEEVMKAQKLWPQFLGHKTSSELDSEPTASKDDETQSEATEATQFLGHKDSLELNCEPSTSKDNDAQPTEAIEVDSKYKDSCIISPITKSPAERSKKPLIEVRVMNIIPANYKSENGSQYPNSAYNEIEYLVSRVVQVPPVPQTAFQFLADWKKFPNNSDSAYTYLKQFPPEKFPSVFKHSMDTELFSGILETLSTSFINRNVDTYPYIKHLSEIGRFNTLIMFLSTSERKAVKKLLDCNKTNRANDPEFSKVMKRYNAAV